MSFRPAIHSFSLGRHPKQLLPQKLKVAATAGFEGVEIVFEDLEFFADTLEGSRHDRLLEAAALVGKVRDSPLLRWLNKLTYRASRPCQTCVELRLTVCVLQPLFGFGGLKDRSEHAKKMKEAKLFFELADRVSGMSPFPQV
jgi:4-hydroxyphenylpyruvate dioxygenase